MMIDRSTKRQDIRRQDIGRQDTERQDIERSALQEEIQQNRPFKSKGQEATLALFRTADMLRRKSSEVFADSGITHQQYNVLRILRGAGADGLPTLSIADRMIEQTPGITRLIDRLVVKDLVIRERVAGDRRRVQCFISETGLELLASLDEPVDSNDGRVMGMLEDEEKIRLIELLDKIRFGLRELEEA